MKPDCQRENLSHMDRAWAFANAIININTGENYTVKEVKKDWKTLAKWLRSKGVKNAGQPELARRTGIPQRTISRYLALLDLDRRLQAAVERKGKDGLPIIVGTLVAKLKELIRLIGLGMKSKTSKK